MTRDCKNVHKLAKGFVQYNMYRPSTYATRSVTVMRLPTGEMTFLPSGLKMRLPLLYTLPHTLFNLYAVDIFYGSISSAHTLLK